MINLIPLADIGDLVPLGELWGTAIGFVVLMTAGIGAIGVGGRNLAVGSMGAYLAFAFYAQHTGIALLETLLYVTLTLILVGTGFKLWRLEGIEAGS